MLSDDEDSGNDDPPYNDTDKDRQEREEQELELEVPDVSENELEENEFEFARPAPAPPRNINQYIDLLTKPYENNKTENNTGGLPVEGKASFLSKYIHFVLLINSTLFVTVLLSIFSYLDDISLWNASEVCRRWRKILEAHTPQTMWQKYIKERWPLYDSLVQKPNWFQVRSDK